MSDIEENFANYPVSIAERKAKGDASQWCPRDALIAALRAIDSGELAPSDVIVVMASAPDDETRPTRMDYFRTVSNSFYGIGMLQAAIDDSLGRAYHA